MDRDDDIRSAQERALSIFKQKPSAALSSAKASGHLDEGLHCTVSSGQLDVRMDVPKALGGDGSAPTPGFFVRAGLIGCVAIGIKMTAAREGVRLESVDVDVEMDFDDGAMLGLGDNTAAPLETRLTITLKSPSPWAAVEEMARRALAADPYYLAFRDAQRVNFTLSPSRHSG
ncbi:MAG TPA: OsmC family protein [Roseiarcus sp.]|nr:OsmC family protein [Roseiarcus sp.]